MGTSTILNSVIDLHLTPKNSQELNGGTIYDTPERIGGLIPGVTNKLKTKGSSNSFLMWGGPEGLK